MDSSRIILLSLKAALEAAAALPALSEPTRRQLIGAARAVARELFPAETSAAPRAYLPTRADR